ncbi:MAG: MFS transporter [Desulfurococcales archaeon]|nr:MFS transporter [Desulfurococcales archaeon]
MGPELSIRRYLPGLLALLTAYVLVYIHRVAIAVMTPELSELLGGSSAEFLVSQITAAYFYAYALMQIPGGVLADVLGIKRYTSLSLLLLFMGSLLFTPLVPSLMIAGRALIGAGAAAIFISLQRFIAVFHSKDVGARITGVALTAGNVGAILATAPLRYLVGYAGLAVTFVVLAIPAVILSLQTYSQIPDLGISARLGLKDSVKATARQLRVVTGSIHSWSLGIILAATYGTTLAFQSYWGLRYFMRVGGVDANTASLYLMAVALTFAAATPLVGHVSDKVIGKRKPLLLLAPVLQAAAWAFLYLLLWGPGTHGTLLTLLAAIALGASSAVHIVIAPMAREVYEREYSGTSFAFVNFLGFSGAALLETLLPLLGGSMNAVLLIYILVNLAASVLARFTRESM